MSDIQIGDVKISTDDKGVILSQRQTVLRISADGLQDLIDFLRSCESASLLLSKTCWTWKVADLEREALVVPIRLASQFQEHTRASDGKRSNAQ